jgi:CBS domain containing-hemolysin-like protein
VCGVVRPARDDVERVGGLRAAARGRVPIPGAAAVVHGLVLTAESVGGRRNRIDSVLVRRVPERTEETEETEAPARDRTSA